MFDCALSLVHVFDCVLSSVHAFVVGCEFGAYV